MNKITELDIQNVSLNRQTLTKENPFLSVIVPCRNEEKYIGSCLDSILAGDYPQDKMEILIVDGSSTDRTGEIVKEYSTRYPFIRLLENSKKIVPSALNLGIRNSRGQVIIRLDAHNTYQKNYISKCVQYLTDYRVDNVGGICITLPGDETLLAGAIAFALSSAFGVGNSYFRIGSKKPRIVNTVPFGCYRKEVFDEIGFFDEGLIRNQDEEFNSRLTINGGKILLAPDIISYYYARPKLSQIASQYFQYGYFKVKVAQKIGKVLTWRQLVPALFVSGLALSSGLSLFFKPVFSLFLLILCSYLLANLACSAGIALRQGLKYILCLPVAFATLHFSYGSGFLKGIWDFILVKKQNKRKLVDLPLTR